MKKEFRQLIGLMTAVMLILSMMSFPVSAEETQPAPWEGPGIKKDETGKWEYNVLEDGTAVITGFTIEGKALSIPDQVDGIPVTMVARNPQVKPDYAKIRAVKTVTLPKGLKAIEQQAFEFFSAMTSINIPQGLEVIGTAAFKECKSLKSIKIPDSVVRIGDEAFSKCSSLVFPKLPATLTEIGNSVFYQCRMLGKVKLPDSVRTVGENAFAYCQITSLQLNEGLETIGANAFFSHKLKEIVFPASLKSIGNNAFNPNINKGLKKLTFNSSSTELGIGIFGYDNGESEYTKKIQRGEIQETEAGYDKNDPGNWLDYYRDRNNFGQPMLTISCYPGSTADQMYQYFVQKTYLKDKEASAVTAPADRVLTAGMYTNADKVYELVVPEGVEELADSAFAGLETLNKITLPATLTKIGAHAFENCIGLKEVVIQAKTMTEIGAAAFKGCSELKKITIPDGIAEIGDSTFEECRKLETVTMPRKGIVKIGDRAFYGCKTLTALKLCPELETIGKEAFRNCAVQTLNLPDSVTSIGKRAFYSTGLINLKFPAEMDEISESLCAYSTKLSKVTMPKKMKRIAKEAFYKCPISGMNLPEGLESIGERAFAFEASNALQEYGKKKTVAKLHNLVIPASVTVIEKEAFLANDVLASISFAKKGQLAEIGESAFAYCLRLGTLTIPESVQTIGDYAFTRCMQLKSVTIGAGVTKIGKSAFEYCPKMTRITFQGDLKTIGQDLLKSHGRSLTVFCPKGSYIKSFIENHFRGVKVKESK